MLMVHRTPGGGGGGARAPLEQAQDLLEHRLGQDKFAKTWPCAYSPETRVQFGFALPGGRGYPTHTGAEPWG